MIAPVLRYGIYACLALTVLGWIGVWLFPAKPWVLVFDNLHWSAGYSAGALLAWQAAINRPGNEGLVQRWTAIGLSAMAFGQFIWDIQVYVSWLPFPGPSDVFFVLMGPLTAAGLFAELYHRISGYHRRIAMLDALTLLLGVLTACMLLFLPNRGEYSVFQLLVMIAYPIGQMLPLCLALVLVLTLRVRFSWSVLCFPLVMAWMAGQWAVWNLRFLADQLVDGALLNIGFSAAGIMLGAVVGRFRLVVEDDPEWDRRCESILRNLPLTMVSVAAVGIVLIQSDTRFGAEVQIAATICGSLVLLVATLRQNTLLLERERLLAAEKLVTQRERELEEINSHLEERIAVRTAELLKANADLTQAGRQLMQSEKLAALGGLVAGVAHELNTPIGNIRIAASTLKDGVEEFSRLMQNNQMSRSALERFLQSCRDGSEILDRASVRADELIQSFKQVAVDQTVMQRRQFDFRLTIEQTLLTLSPMLRRTAHRVEIDIPDDMTLDGYPGAWTQIVSNFVTNSLAHAFADRNEGVMRLTVRVQGNEVELLWEDNGCGIPPDIEHRIFDPFFTTRFGQGGSGLGLYTVYGIVQGILGGSIVVEGRPGSGARFLIRAPLTAPQLKSET